MRQEMHRFFRAARGAGVRVSPAESIDAMKAVADVGFADRAILRDTLLLTLAKSEEEKQALGECFDLFFSQPEVKEETAPEDAAESKSAEFEPKRDGAGRRRRRALAGAWRIGADAAVAGPQRDRGRDGGCRECRLAFRHPLFHPARHLLDPDSRATRDRAAARRSGRADRDQSGGRRTARGGAGSAARKRARCRQSGALALRARGEREPAPRNPAQRAARPGSNAGRSSR